MADGGRGFLGAGAENSKRTLCVTVGTGGPRPEDRSLREVNYRVCVAQGAVEGRGQGRGLVVCDSNEQGEELHVCLHHPVGVGGSLHRLNAAGEKIHSGEGRVPLVPNGLESRDTNVH